MNRLNNIDSINLLKFVIFLNRFNKNIFEEKVIKTQITKQTNNKIHTQDNNKFNSSDQQPMT